MNNDDRQHPQHPSDDDPRAQLIAGGSRPARARAQRRGLELVSAGRGLPLDGRRGAQGLEPPRGVGDAAGRGALAPQRGNWPHGAIDDVNL